jgi:hypothetical protein
MRIAGLVLCSSIYQSVSSLPAGLQTGGNGWFLISRLKEELSGGSLQQQHAQQAQQQQQQQPSPDNSGPLLVSSNELRERCVSRRSFKALACMFGSMVTAAHLQDDMRVIHSVLQLAARIYRRPGGWVGAASAGHMLCSSLEACSTCAVQHYKHEATWRGLSGVCLVR